ncbi:AglZ/HisF2 family acetamidino modification protein [Synechococcus lacustris]|uniref:AglZ/HisF2 family acetamidino modification protein n=1 Tax=Synechococcus lacustris TaxID=2116544 RepID=UPI0020CF85D7|nr:AglZ/HisF2 family acetamidino modification protein [Synechococcus lacustris]MCP9812221.1 imidazole glycerol phosphate synthase subunit HisF [Synechococcus lacustris Maggiore-St4-Slac]
MLKHRVIPILLLQGDSLVKSVKFKSHKYVGDPINTIRIFNEKEVDELVLIDIDASRHHRDPNYELINQCASECFMPLAYGGGIKTIDQAKKLFSLGIEKICVQSAALENPGFLKNLADSFGCQSIIVSIDLKKKWNGKIQIFNSALRKPHPGDWCILLQQLVQAGAGEVLLNVLDKDGTLSGPELNLINIASSSVDVPIIALGGISSMEDIKASVLAGASAVAAGSFFVFHGPHKAVLITYPNYSDLNTLFAENK